MPAPASDVEKTYTITELAEAYDITARAIRFYEDKGLLNPVRQGLQRVYTRRDRARLALILRGKRLGFSLAEIHEMLDLYGPDNGGLDQMQLLHKRARARIEALEQQRRDIDEALGELRQACDVIEDYLAVTSKEPMLSLKDFLARRDRACTADTTVQQ